MFSNPNCTTVQDANSPNHTVCIFYGTRTTKERVPDTLSPNVFDPPWQASTAYPRGSLIVGIVSNNGYVFECTKAGTSGSTEPTWRSTTGWTVTDGSVQWTYEGANPTANFYTGTLSGTGAANTAVKYTQAGLQ